jgi:anti-sigma B factor antagonist
MSPRFAPPFSVTQSDGSHDWLIAVGEIDLMTAQTLSVAIEIAEQHAPPRLTVDLSGVTFIDVSGLRVLLQAARRARAGGRRFAVARPSDQVARLLALTAISRSLDVSEAAPPPERAV